MMSHISLTTAVITMNHPSDTLHLTCNSRFTVMPIASLSPRLSQELAVISTWVTKNLPQETPLQWSNFLPYNSPQICGLICC
jgi:hypothetical protein